MAEHGRGRVENPPKPGIHATPNSFIHAMPAYFKDLGIGGMEWDAGYPDNRDIGLPQIMGTLILNDMRTGAPLCLMDATWITAVRTAAASAVTAKYCARRDSRILGVVGAGVQGRYNLMALKEVLPSIAQVKVIDSNRGAADSFRKELGERIGVEITVCEDVESVARGSDIIVTATQRLSEPLIRDEWFGTGASGSGSRSAARGTGRPSTGPTSLSPTTGGRRNSSIPRERSRPVFHPRHLELGRIVTGQEKGREGDGERILAVNTGLALADIIVASHIYELAKQRGGHQKLTLLEE